LDPELIQLRTDLLNLTDPKAETKFAIEKKIIEREQLLKPMYHQIAVHFADLHDTPERMHDKGVIKVKLYCRNGEREKLILNFVIQNRKLYLGRTPELSFTGDFVVYFLPKVLNLRFMRVGPTWLMDK
jgi:hypothetical protein